MIFNQYFKIGWRNLRRNKAYTAINLLGLSLGVTVCLVIYLIAGFELSFDKNHPDKERIYRVVCNILINSGKEIKLATLPDPAGHALKAEITGFDHATIFRNYYSGVTVPLEGGRRKKFYSANPREEKSEIIITDEEYFKIFRPLWLAGNEKTALKEPFKVVLTKSKAKKYLGEKSPEMYVGKELFYNDSLRLEISGIIEDFGKNSDFDFKDFISFSTVQKSFLKNEYTFDQWGNFNLNNQIFVKLNSGADHEALQRQFSQFVKKHPLVRENETAKIELQPLSDIHFNDSYDDSYSRQVHLPTLYGLIAIAVFILIIASINFINLSTAQSIHRAKEIGIRKVMGSSRSSLTIQLLCETFLLTVFAIVISLMVLKPALVLLGSFLPSALSVELFDLDTLGFLLLIAVITSLLAGLYPARVLSAYLPAVSLKGNPAEKGNQKVFLRKALIVFQFTISLIFIIAAIAAENQLLFFLTKDMGFVKESVINIETHWSYPPEKKEVLASKIGQLPEVELVSLSEGTPAATGHWGTNLKYLGKELMEVDCELHFVDEKFLPLYEMKVIAGRNLTPSDTMKEFIINETCAKGLGFSTPQEAIGKLVESGITDTRINKKFQIVGVVADFHSRSLHEKLKPSFIATSKTTTRLLSIKLAGTKPSGPHLQTTLKKIEKLWEEVYPNEKFEYNFFDHRIARFYEKEQKTASVIRMATGIAVFISCIGLFGLSTLVVHQRTKEIGIRKVLGASVSRIISLICSDFLALVLISFLIATPVAWYLIHKWLQNFAYRVEITVWLFVIAGLTGLIIALATVSYQSIKAAMANPSDSLRME